MKIINAGIELIDAPEYTDVLRLIEIAGRTCYKSPLSDTDEQREDFIRRAIQRGHESIIEHAKVTIKIICDRGVSHEIVRHRIASYSQESTRYCNYANDRFDGELTFIKPCFWYQHDDLRIYWNLNCRAVEELYLKMLEMGATPEQARTILPNSLKTEVVMTANMREWRHFLKLRTDAAAHPQMREIADMILTEFKKRYPVFVEDMKK